MTPRQISDIRYLRRMARWKPHGLYYRVRCGTCDLTLSFGDPRKAVGFINLHEDHDTGVFTSRAPAKITT